MQEISLPLLTSLQLAALGPCLFMILYVLLFTRHRSQALIPVLLFSALGIGFLLPVLKEFPLIELGNIGALEQMSSQLVLVFSFLMVVQLLNREMPHPLFWFILCIPLVGGGPLFYLALENQNVCFSIEGCFEATYLLHLFTVFGGAMTFALLIALMTRKSWRHRLTERGKFEIYWLVIALILFNLLSLANDLLLVAERIKPSQFHLFRTVIGLAFVYVLLTSIFRALIRPLNIRSLEELQLSSRDRALTDKMLDYLESQKPYLQLGFHRSQLADRLAVTEQKLSQVFNRHYGKSFSDVMNSLRIEEARKRLEQTEDAVTTISYDTGFSSIASFNRVFKQETGVSPTEYRRQLKNPI